MSDKKPDPCPHPRCRHPGRLLERAVEPSVGEVMGAAGLTVGGDGRGGLTVGGFYVPQSRMR